MVKFSIANRWIFGFFRVADVFTKKKRSQIMAAVRSRGNKNTELKLAAILRSARINGWRRHQPLPGHPDFVFRRPRLLIFVDGCFWHGCPRHLRMPQANRAYWKSKIARNVKRDAAHTRALRLAGWRVMRVWEHSLRDPAIIADRIKTMLKE